MEKSSNTLNMCWYTTFTHPNDADKYTLVNIEDRIAGTLLDTPSKNNGSERHKKP